MIINEAEMHKQKCINVLMGSLDTPNETVRIECLPLESSRNVKSSVILYTMIDVLCQRGTKRENFALLLRQMLLGTCLWLAKH